MGPRNTNTVISPSDQVVQDTTVLDEDYHFETKVKIVMSSVAPAPMGRTVAFAQDLDSASTILSNKLQPTNYNKDWHD